MARTALRIQHVIEEDQTLENAHSTPSGRVKHGNELLLSCTEYLINAGISSCDTYQVKAALRAPLHETRHDHKIPCHEVSD